MNLHTLPINDIGEHILSEFCQCLPERTGPQSLTHSSFDGREFFEEPDGLEGRPWVVVDEDDCDSIMKWRSMEYEYQSLYHA